MKKIDLGQTINTLANVGVIAGIIFLAVQVRLANRIALVTAEYDLRNNFSAINDAVLTNTDLADFIHAFNQGAPLKGSDIERARSWVFRNMNAWVAASFAYENGIATETTYNNVLDNVRAELAAAKSSPQMLAMWRDSYDRFPSLHSTPVFVLIHQLLDKYQEKAAQ